MVTFSRMNLNDVEHSENVVVMNSNDMTQSMELHMTSPDFKQNPKYTNHCICTCCHKPDFTKVSVHHSSRHQGKILTIP